MEDLRKWFTDEENILHKSGIFYSSLLLTTKEQIVINLILLSVKSKD